MTWQHSAPPPQRPAPRQGEHTREILQDAGYSSAEIDDLVAAGAAGEATPAAAAL